jgi:hypothetical protein
MRTKRQLMSYNMMIGYDIYDCFTMEHFRFRQRMTLTTKIFCSRLYIDMQKKYCVQHIMKVSFFHLFA